MKSIHPFPARMAPDIISGILNTLKKDAVVLDPMCGSGTVLRHSIESKRNAIGFDIDPLSVKMSRAWTSSPATSRRLPDAARMVVDRAAKLNLRTISLPWMDSCSETTKFIDYWFACRQRNDLRKLSYVLMQLTAHRRDRLSDCLWVSLSRLIVTKHSGASLAWDVSHSRPHKVRDDNDFDVFHRFIHSADKLAETLALDTGMGTARVYRGDCRKLSSVRERTVDAVVTSPPYLNAIDYLRGHKLALVWMGHTIPELRLTRANSIGAERSISNSDYLDEVEKTCRKVANISSLPSRQAGMVKRYISDTAAFFTEMRRVLKPDGQLTVVLGDCNIRGLFVENSRIFREVGKLHGFKATKQSRRALVEAKRYLPISSTAASLEQRMRYEVIQTYNLR